MKRYTAIIPALFLFACSSTKTTPVAVTKPAGPAYAQITTLAPPAKPEVAQLAQQAYSAEQLNQGKALYAQHCAACHDLKNPTSQSTEEWKMIVPSMVARANKKHPNTIDDNTKDLLLNYLITMSTPESDRQ